MKKIRLRAIIILILLILVALFLFFPFSTGVMNDGGTVAYCAMTYSVIKWHRNMLDENGNPYVYEKTRVYIFPHNHRDIDDLWELEMEKAKN